MKPNFTELARAWLLRAMGTFQPHELESLAREFEKVWNDAQAAVQSDVNELVTGLGRPKS